MSFYTWLLSLLICLMNVYHEIKTSKAFAISSAIRLPDSKHQQ